MHPPHNLNAFPSKSHCIPLRTSLHPPQSIIASPSKAYNIWFTYTDHILTINSRYLDHFYLYLGNILIISWQHLFHSLTLYWPYIARHWPYLSNISFISKPYLDHILTKYWPYIGHILAIYCTYIGHTLVRSWPYLDNISATIILGPIQIWNYESFLKYILAKLMNLKFNLSEQLIDFLWK